MYYGELLRSGRTDSWSEVCRKAGGRFRTGWWNFGRPPSGIFVAVSPRFLEKSINRRRMLCT